MNNPDPEDQFQHISPFAYCANNPVSHIDPDGRFAFMPFLMTTLFSAHISGMLSQSSGGSYGNGFITGAVTSAIGGGIGTGMTSILGQSGTWGGAFLRGAAGGFVSGGISGGVSSMMNGGNFSDGFLGGALTGGIAGGIMAGIGHLKMVSQVNKVLNGQSLGSPEGESMIYDAEQADLEMQFQHGSDDKQRLNIKNIKLGESWNKDFPRSNDPYLSDKGVFKQGAWAKTFGSKETGSIIYFGKKSFQSFTTFHNISTHEMIHAFHFSLGLYGGQSVNHPMVGTFNYSEYGAYSLNVFQESKGAVAAFTTYSGILSGYEGFSGTKYAWNRIYEKLPTFNPIRRIP
jgi:hypothetical protein